MLGILDLTAVTTPWLALAMYLGWGLALPAIYSSFRLASRVLGRRGSTSPPTIPAPLVGMLALIGLPLANLALFFGLWVGGIPGWFVAPVFCRAVAPR